MRRLSLLLSVAALTLASLAPPLALAAGTTATLKWTHPTTWTDGQPIAVADIKETLIQWRRPGTDAVSGEIRVAGPAATVTVADLVCGNFEFIARTVMKAGDATSVPSAAAPYATGVTCTPNPPGGLEAS